jgi:hypothetical protein
MGKETLLKKNIIYYPNPAKKVLTKLNPGAFDAENFEEAENIVLHKKPELSRRSWRSSSGKLRSGQRRTTEWWEKKRLFTKERRWSST